MFDFQNKVVLITGAAQGFGRVCALAFADRGAKLAPSDINDQGGEETLRQVKSRKADGFYLHADVAKEDQVKQFVDETVSRFGRLDVAMNNAAKEIAGPTLDLPSSAFDAMVDVNLKGVYYGMKHQVVAMGKPAAAPSLISRPSPAVSPEPPRTAFTARPRPALLD